MIISTSVPLTLPSLGSISSPPEEALTPRDDRCAKDHRAANHISKTVPPNGTRTPHRRGRQSDLPLVLHLADLL